MGSIRIRRAGKDDVGFLAWAVVAAARSHVSRGAWDLIVPESDEERLRFVSAVLLGRPSWCHYAPFRIAEVDGEAAAALASYPVKGGGMIPPEEILPEVARAQGWSDERLAAAFGRMAPFLGCIPEDHSEAWSIEWVATAPRHRRRGLAGRLLAEALDEGHAKGHPVAQLMILIGNAAAQRAYEKAGFEIVDERRSEAFEAAIGSPGLARMERPF